MKTTVRQIAGTVSSHVDRRGRREVTFTRSTATRPGRGLTQKRSSDNRRKGAKKLRVTSVPEDTFGFEPEIHNISRS